LLIVLALAAAAAALFDWNWFRHPLELYLAERSQREVRIGDLHVDAGFSLEPTVRVRDVYVENAPWANKGPAVVAGEASFTFSLTSLWNRRPVISRLVLIDATVQLERREDGLRNWRLTNPEDRSPGRVKVLRLEPHRTTIRVILGNLDLDVLVAASQVGANVQPPAASQATQIEFKGQLGGTAIAGQFQTGGRLTLLDTGESFALRGHATAGNSRLDVDGTVADLARPFAIDARVRLAGRSLSDLHPIVGTAMPASRPYELEARVRLAEDDVLLDDVRARIGKSDIAGTIGIDLRKERARVRAELRSESADLADFGALAGARQVPAKPAERQVAASGPARSAPTGRGPEDSSRERLGRLFSERAFNGEQLKTLDAHVTLNASKLTTVNLPELESLRVSAELKDGVLALSPIDVGLAGGHVVGWLTFDGRRTPISSHGKVDFKQMRIERLLDRLAKGAQSTGQINGHFDLRGQGDSLAKTLASATGSMEVSMAGGGISNLLDAKLGLNTGKVLRLMITGDQAIAIHSAVVAFDFEQGLGKSKAILLDTDQTRTEGTGTIDLRNETVDVLLTPHPKKPGLISPHSAIHVHGPIRKVEFSLAATAEKREMEPSSSTGGDRPR
jgi:uncharacterized protein involved in outer membrane biogenesis